jgi:membrane-associated protein
VPEWWSELSDLSAWTGPTLYLVVFALVFTECGIPLGFLLPGDTVLFAAGLLSGRPGTGIDTLTMATVVTVAAILGDLVGYETGRRLGRPWLERRARGRSHAQLDRADAFVTRWGVLAVIVCRFIPWLRTFVPLLAGVGRMRYASFAGANVAGALIWGAGLVVLGRVAHENETVRMLAYAVAGTAIAISIGAAAGSAIRRRRGAEPDPG